LLLVILTVLIIHFLMINKKQKGIILSIILICLFTICYISSIPNEYNGNNVIFNLKYKSNVCYYVKDNEVTLIGSNVDSRLIINEMKKLKINKITNIIAYDLQINDIENLETICQEYSVETIYLPVDVDYKSIRKRVNNCKFFATNIIIDSMQFNAIEYKDQIIAVTLKIDGIGTILIPEINPTKAESKYLIDNYATIDFIYTNSDNLKLDLTQITAKKIICNESDVIECIDLEECETFILNEKIIGDML